MLPQHVDHLSAAARRRDRRRPGRAGSDCHHRSSPVRSSSSHSPGRRQHVPSACTSHGPDAVSPVPGVAVDHVRLQVARAVVHRRPPIGAHRAAHVVDSSAVADPDRSRGRPTPAAGATAWRDPGIAEADVHVTRVALPRSARQRPRSIRGTMRRHAAGPARTSDVGSGPRPASTACRTSAVLFRPLDGRHHEHPAIRSRTAAVRAGVPIDPVGIQTRRTRDRDRTCGWCATRSGTSPGDAVATAITDGSGTGGTTVGSRRSRSPPPTPRRRAQGCGREKRDAAAPAEPSGWEGPGPAGPLAQSPGAIHDRGVEPRRRARGRFGLEPLLQVPFELRVRVHRATSTAPTAGRSSASRAARIACVALLRRDCIVPSGIASASADSASERPR